MRPLHLQNSIEVLEESGSSDMQRNNCNAAMPSSLETAAERMASMALENQDESGDCEDETDHVLNELRWGIPRTKSLSDSLTLSSHRLQRLRRWHSDSWKHQHPPKAQDSFNSSTTTTLSMSTVDTDYPPIIPKRTQIAFDEDVMVREYDVIEGDENSSYCSDHPMTLSWQPCKEYIENLDDLEVERRERTLKESFPSEYDETERDNDAKFRNTRARRLNPEERRERLSTIEIDI